MQLEAGYALAAKMNAHRHQWNGTICAQPQGWNCGAPTDFRENFCASGLLRCFHLHVFDPARPKFVTPDSTVVHALRERPTLLDNQIIFFYGGRFGAQQGIRPSDTEESVYGFYRVKSGSLDTTRSQHSLVLEPYSDGWAMFPRVHLRPPTLRALPDFKYLKKVRFSSLTDVIQQALEQGASLVGTAEWTAEQQRRLQKASEALPRWLTKAQDSLAKLPPPKEPARISIQDGHLPGALESKLRRLKIEMVMPVSRPAAHEPPKTDSTVDDAPAIGVRQAVPAEDQRVLSAAAAPQPIDADAITSAPHVEGHGDADQRQPTVDEADGVQRPGGDTTAATDPSKTTQEQGEAVGDSIGGEVAEPDSVHEWLAVPEPRARGILADRFGRGLTNALAVAFVTKSLVILTGSPGAGKSWIASRLLDDDARNRTVIVPVASTWRGREDLLGYVNPITGNFEPTQFTLFLCNAQEAWERGDHRGRLAVFEEFNLSQPEHWLSDLLVRLEYEPEQWTDRTVPLGGKEIEGRPGRPCSVVLVPSLRFVGTLNNDHTVKPLSPRVLDRAALIEVTTSGRTALIRAGVELNDDTADVIDELNDLLAPRGAAFSVRSARSLQRALDAGFENGMEIGQALDLVLAQEVLSRVRLLAGDPRDEQLLTRLQAWTQKPGCTAMNVCAARIADWAELMGSGRDVFQA
jgi:hypothetical protein